MRIVAVIPARYHSTRLPAKPLVDIEGKPMIAHVYERAKKAKRLDDVIVATDDERIKDVVEGFGGKAFMTSATCASGSDRLLEVAKTEIADIYINIQGDEPLLDPNAIDLLAEAMSVAHPPSVATLCYRVSSKRALDPNLVKIVLSNDGYALYFSRSPIPYDRDQKGVCPYFAHIGIYAYTREALEFFGSLPPSPLEEIEKLEQLRLLQAGRRIRVIETSPFGPGVDTEEDLAVVRQIMRGERSEEEETDISEKLKGIRLIITDVDGVLTDGSLFYGADGENMKCFNVRDGLGCVLAKKHGLEIAVVSGKDSPALRRRLSDLGISAMRLGRLDKKTALKEIFEETGRGREESLFLGDDIPDIEGFRGCSLGVAVADAHPRVKKKANICLQTCGGRGALREVIDRIFEERGEKI